MDAIGEYYWEIITVRESEKKIGVWSISFHNLQVSYWKAIKNVAY